MATVPGSLHITFKGDVQIDAGATLLAFWQWAFSDLCDDDIKGVFAEWMVATLLGLPLRASRRVSWADSDIVLPNGNRVEVKATAVWQSWKLVNHDGTPKPLPPVARLEPARIRFCGLQARTQQGSTKRNFKSDFYVFCFHHETDPAAWDAWNLAQWEFYLMTRDELSARRVGGSISLSTLREVQPPMSAVQFQTFARVRLGITEVNSSSVST